MYFLLIIYIPQTIIYLGSSESALVLNIIIVRHSTFSNHRNPQLSAHGSLQWSGPANTQFPPTTQSVRATTSNVI